MKTAVIQPPGSYSEGTATAVWRLLVSPFTVPSLPAKEDD